MAFNALMEAGFPNELADKIVMEKAALTIQSFVRRSLFRVEWDTDDLRQQWPCNRFKNALNRATGQSSLWHPPHAQHGSAAFMQGGLLRTVFSHRYKPLGIVLKGMMQIIVERQKKHYENKQRNKRKNQYFRVTLMRRTKLFGDVPIITVRHNTVFHN